VKRILCFFVEQARRFLHHFHTSFLKMGCGRQGIRSTNGMMMDAIANNAWSFQVVKASLMRRGTMQW
jgi:hypothetical protein